MMFANKTRILHWTPRILAVVFILFISLFALDVFSEYDTLREIGVALFIHVIPSFLLIIVTAIAWRWRLTGGILFMLLGLVSVVFFKSYWHIFTFLFVSLPPLLLGLFFIWDSFVNHSKLDSDGSMS